eukprot:INCI14310.1.p1 GENE.INCI14310.1~~INCI14310.1.p1  ORF type:complete len:558 (-),score=62.44 INCI14310.1:66-1739(-)
MARAVLPLICALCGCSCVLSFGVAGAAGEAETPPVVNSSLGPVRGIFNDAGGVSFLGIPYGDAVSGDFRWTAPRAARPWAPRTLNATTQPPGCPATASGEEGFIEDCLNLNIYMPRFSGGGGGEEDSEGARGLLPVVFWIHGGGFMIGDVAKPLWQGEFLVAQSVSAGTPVIMVSADYRLGALGFLASEELGLAGNYGLLDQQLALRWIRDHIAAFGGDPSRVTIHGQSAGAMSAHLHLVSPSSAGLFQRAHIRSDVGLHYRNISEASKHADVLAATLLCFDQNSTKKLECLRGKSTSQVVQAQGVPEYIVLLTEPGFGLNFLQWLPVVDGSSTNQHGESGGVLPGNPLSLLQEGHINPGVEAVVIGTMMNESLAFAPWKILGGLKGLEAEAFLDLFLDVQFESVRRDGLKALYAGSSTSPVTQATTTLTDYLFTCYCNAVAEALSSKCNVSTYVYTFRHIPSDHADPDNHEGCRPELWNAACHAGDNMFAFGTDTICANASFTPFEKQLSNAYISVDINLTAAAPGALASSFGLFGSRFVETPHELLFKVRPPGNR